MRNNKEKVLSIFMLIALVANNLLYPINYVTAQDSGDVEIIETSIGGENFDVELDVPVSDDSLELENPENVLEKNGNDGVLSGDNEELTGNDSVLSGDNEIINSEEGIVNNFEGNGGEVSPGTDDENSPEADDENSPEPNDEINGDFGGEDLGLNDLILKDKEEILLSDIKGLLGENEEEPVQTRGISGRGIMDQMPDFDYAEIVIPRPDSVSVGPELYIIMDRNLGATTSGTSVDAYGYYYQWGNNYGFATTGDISNVLKSEVNIDLSLYGPASIGMTPYYSGVYVRTPTSETNRAEWAMTGNDNIWGGTGGTLEDRQGPCPTGWHIPSKDERNQALTYWKGGDQMIDLKLPPAGNRGKSSGDVWSNAGTEIQLWTSTPINGGKAYALSGYYTSSGYTMVNNKERADGVPIRCFKNTYSCDTGFHLEGNTCVPNSMTGFCYQRVGLEHGHYTGTDEEITITWNGNNWEPICAVECDEGYEEKDNMCVSDDGSVTVTFKLNGGIWYDGFTGDRVVTIESGVDVDSIRPTNDPYKLGDETYSGYMLLGWFQDVNSNDRFHFQGTTLASDTILIAKWAPYNDIQYCASGNCVTIMDRHLGATSNDISNPNSYGYYYQWGNNYGFTASDLNNYSTKPVSTIGYGPGNRYYGETFIKVGDKNWSSTQNENLWGGGGDTVGENSPYYDSMNARWQRQGPCPKGYHVPSANELHLTMTIFMDKYGVSSSITDNWPTYVGLENDANFILTSLYSNFQNDFKIPLAGRIKGSATLEFYGQRGQYWSSTPFIGANSAVGVQDKQGIYNMGGWKDQRSYAKSVRCYKDGGEYTVRWKNYDNSELEVDYYVYNGATPTYDQGVNPTNAGGYEFIGWYVEGDETQTIVDLPQQTVRGDITYMAKFEQTGHEETYHVAVDIDPIGGGIVQGERQYGSGDEIVLTGVASEGFEFLGWFTGNTLISTANPYIFTADNSDGTGFTAVFAPLYSIYTGTNNELGGTVSYEVMDITRQGKRIRFTATPAEFFALDKWILNGVDTVAGGSSQLDVILSGNINLTGYFVQVANFPCNFHGESITNGESITGYQSDSVTCPNVCVSQVATCENGERNVENFETEYSYSACNYSGFTCSVEEYPLQTCPENGICSSCTGYTVSENACVPSTPIYKLDSCSGHYHVSGDVCEINTYEITWTFRNSSGDWVTNTGNYVWGSSFTPFIPTYPKTLQTKYTFVGWEPELSIVTDDTGYTAIYTEEPRPYTITFVSSSENYGTVSPASVIEGYGTPISISNNTITISGTTVTATATGADAQYTYAFSGWTGDCGNLLTHTCTITAIFNQILNSYTITWTTHEGSTTGTVNYGVVPTHENPVNYVDNNMIYIFSGWIPEPIEVIGNAEYLAVYIASGCEEGYHDDNGLCVSEKEGVCKPVANPITNATYTETGAYIWSGDEWEAPICEFIGCNGETHLDGNACVSEKEGVCTTPGNVDAHGRYTTTGAYTWENDQWNAPECTFIECENNYHLVGNECISNNDIFVACDATTLPINTVVKVGNFVQKWTETGFFPETKLWTYNGDECGYLCADNYIWNGSVCILDDGGNEQGNQNGINHISNNKPRRKDRCLNGDFSNSHYDGDCGVSRDDKNGQTHGSAGNIDVFDEYRASYEWAFENNLVNGIQISDRGFERSLTRIEVSKLLSDFAINVLGKTYDGTKNKNFVDVSKQLDEKYSNSVSVSYNLGIMGINMPNNRFKPFWIVTRSEFITALSRVTYGTVDGSDVYYSTHMNLMEDLGVIKYANPDIVETVGYALIILKRLSDLLVDKN